MDLVHLESFIRRNVSFEDLPAAVKQKLGHSKKEFEKSVISFSIRNQLRYRGNLVRLIRKDEKKYYDELVDYSKRNLMLYPYHLSDIVVPVLKTTPFLYYVSMLESLMAQEKSYDSLPNFTAADCLRLLGIGRNQYIDLMNSNRSGKKFGFFRKRGVDLLPSQPVDNLAILPWWLVRVGHVTEDDVRAMSKQEHDTIDKVIDLGASAPAAGTFEHAVIKQLHLKGLIYFDVPIEDNDYVVVPPLENFVMNRVLGDFFETLLYKIFVSIDEHTSVGELAAILEVDGEDIRNAVSLYCRLGIAKKKNADMDSNDLHPSWYDAMTLNSSLASNVSPPPAKGPARTVSVSSEDEDDSLLRELAIELEQEKRSDSPASIVMASGGSGQAFKTMLSTSSSMGSSSLVSPNNAGAKKIGFLFDSTLTAYLMMGNLSPGLKTHAVTMFEVGKLSDESLDHLVCELDKVSQGEGEGEAARYFSHAITLRQTILFLRQNCAMEEQDAASSMCLGLDLIRCESLQSLDPSTVSRLLSKNYSLLVSMAPLKYEIRPHLDCFPPHLGPSVAEVSSIWFKLFLYNATGYGPPSLFLPKGFRIKRLPRIFDCCSRLLVTSWAHDPSDIPMSSALTMVMDALQHSPVLVQAYCEVGLTATPSLKSLAFPPTPATEQNHPDSCWWKDTKSLVRLQELVDLEHSCGFITLLKLPTIQHKLRGGHLDPKECHEGQLDTQGAEILAAELDSLCNEPPSYQKPQLDGDQCASGDWILLDVNFGVPLWDPDLNNEVCKRIVSHQLWKPDSLSRLTEANRSLSQRLMDFIHGCQKSSVPWPSQMLAMPMQPLFFDGRQLHYRIPNHA